MEQEPFSEKREITDQELIDALRARGVDDPEARRLRKQWTEQEERKIGPSSADSIEFNRRKARLYLAAGCREAALEALEAASMQAWNERRDELYREISAEMDAMEKEG